MGGESVGVAHFLQENQSLSSVLIRRSSVGVRLNVSPTAASDNLCDCALTRTEQFAQHSLRHDAGGIHGTNLNHLRRRQNRVLMGVSSQGVKSAFLRAISHVVFLCTNEQMRRVAAGRIVAAMAHKKTFRDLAICNDPCQPMCQPSHSRFGTQCDDAVTVSDGVFANKLPAFIRPSPIHIGPEAVCQRRLFDFPPAPKSAAIFDRYLLQWRKWVFEFHTGWIVRLCA